MPLRVALLSPPYGSGSTNSMRPLGLIAIHSYLSRELAGEIELTLFDYSDVPETQFEYLEPLGTYDVVGLCAYSTNFPVVLEWSRALRKQFPAVKQIVGGPHPTATAVHTASAHRQLFDFVVRGEGERPMVAILRSLIDGQPPPRVPGVLFWDEATKSVVSIGSTDPTPKLDTVPVPLAPIVSPFPNSLECYDKRLGRMRKAFPFTTSRGCPFSCTFCSIRASDSKWRSVSAQRLGEWVAAARELDPEIEHINFMDADFLIDKKRVVAIGEMFATRHPGITWSFSARVDDLARLGEPALRILSTQGLIAVEVGFESGSQGMLDRMGKNVTVQQNYDAVAMLDRVGLDMLIDFILFLPDETPEQLQESVTFIKNAGLAEYLPHEHFFTYLTQYPSTPLRNFTEKLMNRKFSLDVLPEPDDLFIHPGTKNIFRLFMREFAPLAQGKLKSVIGRVDRAAARVKDTDRSLAQQLRLESISLRHLPILMLEALIATPNAATIEDAAPWYANVRDHLATLDSVCRDVLSPRPDATTAQAAA